MKIGLKLWSSNHHLFSEAVELFEKKEFDFIEMHAENGSFDTTKLEPLKGIPVNIHSPNENHFNLMQKSEENEHIFQELFQFADYFNSEYIVIHPGIGNHKEILFNNLEKMKSANNKDRTIIIENVPKVCVWPADNLYGYTYEMMKEILEVSGAGFCLDFTHAIKSAKSQNIDAKEFINKLMTLNPKVFHVCDADSEEEKDQHMNLGKGNLDLAFIKSKILENGSKMVVFETPKEDGLSNDVKNMDYFRGL